MSWQSPGTVPKRIKAFRDFVHDRTTSEKIKITEVRLFVYREVSIAKVAPADDRYHIVHDKGFVVHTMVDPRKIEERILSTERAASKGVIESYLDVGVRRKGSQSVVLSYSVQIVQE